MKEFNLEKALAGEPVRLRNGTKAWVVADISRLGCKGRKHGLIVVDIYGGVYDYESNGRFLSDEEHELDIVGIYDGIITVGKVSFPAPLANLPELGTQYYAVDYQEPAGVAVGVYNADDRALRYFSANIMHLTASAASLHANALLNINRGDF